MLEGFEDAFVDAQSRVVSLCLELLKNSEKEADKIYIYLFQNDEEDYIDAFFEKEGNLYTTSELFSEEEIDDFFDCGVEDIENIIDIDKRKITIIISSVLLIWRGLWKRILLRGFDFLY